MRKSQKNIIYDSLRRYKIMWLLKQVGKIPLLHLSRFLKNGHALNGPVMATIVPTNRCNLDCQFCNIKDRHDDADGVGYSKSDILTLVDQLCELNVSGIGFSGGEPLLHAGTIPAIRYARQKGLSVVLATNGTTLTDHKIDQIITADPNNITISIDSSDPVVHDKLRNVELAYAKTFDAISKLRNIIASKKLSIQTTIVTVICNENADQIDDIIFKAKSLGLDAVGFIPEHYSLKGKFVPKINDKCFNISSEILKHGKDILENSDWYIKSFDSVIRNGSGPNLECSQGYSSITIGPNGQLYACWPDYLNNSPFLKIDITEKSALKKAWNSEAYRQKRLESLKCHSCFINCIAELNHIVRFW